jgi:hypothetical protein
MGAGNKRGKAIEDEYEDEDGDEDEPLRVDILMRRGEARRGDPFSPCTSSNLDRFCGRWSQNEH